VDTGIPSRERVGTITEALIHLTKHANWDVREIEVAPIKFGLDSISNGTPAMENRMEMSEDSLSHQMLGTLEETKICRLTRIAAIGRNGFVDEREEVTIEGRVKPRRGLRGFLCCREGVFEVVCSRADIVALVFQHDAPVYEEAEEERAARHRKDFERIQPSLAFFRDELVRRLCE